MKLHTIHSPCDALTWNVLLFRGRSSRAEPCRSPPRVITWNPLHRGTPCFKAEGGILGRLTPFKALRFNIQTNYRPRSSEPLGALAGSRPGASAFSRGH